MRTAVISWFTSLWWVGSGSASLRCTGCDTTSVTTSGYDGCVNRSPYSFGAAVHRQRLLLVTLGIVFFVVLPIGVFFSVPTAGYALSVLLFALAVVRLILPVDALGALVVRRRSIDVATILILAVLVCALSSSPGL